MKASFEPLLCVTGLLSSVAELQTSSSHNLVGTCVVPYSASKATETQPGAGEARGAGVWNEAFYFEQIAILEKS